MILNNLQTPSACAKPVLSAFWGSSHPMRVRDNLTLLWLVFDVAGHLQET